MEKKVHLYFSLLMSIFMVAVMSFVVSAVNIGFNEHLIAAWLTSFAIAWVVAFPIIFFFAPMIKKFATRLVQMK
jgi:uncharacterized protein HemY